MAVRGNKHSPGLGRLWAVSAPKAAVGGTQSLAWRGSALADYGFVTNGEERAFEENRRKKGPRSVQPSKFKNWGLKEGGKAGNRSLFPSFFTKGYVKIVVA